MAYALASHCLPKYSSKFSRKDFTLPQLFACLVVREHQRQTFRGVEALLRDAEHGCRDIGMSRAPDHNTLCRAFHALNLGRRCRHYALPDRAGARSTRSRSAKRAPKLALACATKSHVILSARPRIGMGSDAPDFEPVLLDARRRIPGGKLRTVLADAGYDSESNHRIARLEMGVRSLIKAGVGRPSAKPPTGHYRRLMRRQLDGSQKGKPYGQRAQVETVASMLKRNLGDSLRARTARGRRHEMIFRSITHDVMIRRFARVETEPA